jgi:hypothetical protein
MCNFLYLKKYSVIDKVYYFYFSFFIYTHINVYIYIYIYVYIYLKLKILYEVSYIIFNFLSNY